jgi:hypothetical protein
MLELNRNSIKTFAEKSALSLIVVRSILDELSSKGAASTALESVARAFQNSGFVVIREGQFWNIIQ